MKEIQLLDKETISNTSKSFLSHANDNWARIEVKFVGLCGSDIHRYKIDEEIFKNKILGHEFTGIISKIENNRYGLKKGMEITVIPLVYCGQCDFCRQGKFNHCKNLKSIGKEIPGAFSKEVFVPIRNIRRLPKEINLKLGTLIDPIAVAIHTYHKIKKKQQKNILIVGDGTIGLCCLNIFSRTNCVDVIGKHKYNLSLCSSLGARNVYKSGNIKSIPINSYDVIIECVGGAQSETLNESVRLLKPSGTILVLGVFKKKYMGELNYRNLFYKEGTLLGVNSYCIFRGQNEFDLAIKELKENYKCYKDIITHVFPLSNLNMALNYIKERDNHNIIKPIFYID